MIQLFKAVIIEVLAELVVRFVEALTKSLTLWL